MRFLLDEDLPPRAAEVARGLGLDVISVHELDRRGVGDRDQLRFASGAGRIFLTRNHRDFIELTVEFHRAGEAYAGVLLVSRSLPNDRPERIAYALKRWAEARADMPATFDGVDFLLEVEAGLETGADGLFARRVVSCKTGLFLGSRGDLSWR